MALSFLTTFGLIATIISVLATPLAVASDCPVVAKPQLTDEWDPRSLAGEYRVEWFSDTSNVRKTKRLRLFLWPTSMLDSSVKTGKRPGESDTVSHPLFGILVRDIGHFSASRIRQLRQSIDPIFPPVLFLSDRFSRVPDPTHYWNALLLGTISNRRDSMGGFDGAGIGMWVRQVTTGGFRGTFEPWGIVMDDRGYYCAERVRH
jgi:hypothetical protein